MGSGKTQIGEISWVDLTVPDAAGVKDFYRSVTGWTVDAFDMGGYSDFMVSSPTSKETVAGICHARGDNAALPPSWLIYVKVENLDASIAAAKREGGEIVVGPKSFGAARFCVLKDPAGAAFAIIEGEAGGDEGEGQL